MMMALILDIFRQIVHNFTKKGKNRGKIKEKEKQIKDSRTSSPIEGDHTLELCFQQRHNA